MAGRPAQSRALGFPRIAEPPLSPAATVVAVIGAVVLVIGCVLTSGADEGPDSAAAAPTDASGAGAVSPTTRDWYTSTEQTRTGIVTSVAAARSSLDAQDGTSLQPACTQLMDETKAARQLPPGPDVDAQRLYASGVASYSEASQTCRHLFDGSEIPIDKLQSGMRTALEQGDGYWAELATRLGLPAAVAASTGTGAGAGAGDQAGAGGQPGAPEPEGTTAGTR